MIQQQHQHQQPSTSSSNTSNYLSYDQSLDEQRKSIDDQLKRLDNQLLTKVSELTLMQQHHIQMQQQQNRNLKSSNAALVHSSRASLNVTPSSMMNRTTIHQSMDVTDNLRSQSNISNSLQSLNKSYKNEVDDRDDQEIFYWLSAWYYRLLCVFLPTWNNKRLTLHTDKVCIYPCLY